MLDDCLDGTLLLIDLLGVAPNEVFAIGVDDVVVVVVAVKVIVEETAVIVCFSDTVATFDGVDAMVEVLTICGLLAGDMLFLGNMDNISASGSFTNAEIRKCACFVASATPLMVIERSPWVLPCFSTSIWAPVAARIALILLPPRPMTREIALTGTCIFLQPISGIDVLDDDCC